MRVTDSEIPCIHEDISLMGGTGECEEGNDGFYECGPTCPEYKPRTVKWCKKHHIHYVEDCNECFDEYWERQGRKLAHQMSREHWMEEHLHSTVKCNRKVRGLKWQT